ncbi:uncharacterized protein AC631_04122 [Debaryomyces fabryi]|uniref:Spt20-like SEP domain-containing protein n=1 Tax=Debaryomyces fabryi TaxID=58627 RepID=A0A0V1PV09_9ASCO|nr:uncharacterized protein AC631_04122 [Debaryomyces fabryi]KSA00121.1 hypothetical protein AC631_04122 [Debaryomyces fabryi]CUM56997.1 unnamed protein product [Debaryomyces fabryi]
MINTGASKVPNAPHNRTTPSAQAQAQAHLQHSKLTAQQQQLLRQRQQQQLLQQQQQQQLAQQRLPRPNLQNYHFATTSPEILKKYAKYPPSLSFHIYESHYRLSNSQDSNIIPKSSPMIKSFLQHVMREEIPFEMSELIKDFAIRSYDGCLILQVYDHRNMIPTGAPATSNTNSSAPTTNNDRSNAGGLASTNVNTVTDTTTDTNGSASKSASPSQSNTKSDSNSNTTGSSAATATSESAKVISKPKAYRTLLRPTQLSLYYDLLYHTDSALTKFTDPLSLQMESEILTLANRKLDLSVPLNPYLCDDYLKPEIELPRKEWDEKNQDWKLIHLHRQEVENPPRKLHQDELIMHKSSDYEEIMFLLSNKYKRSDDTLDKKLVVVGSSSLVSTGTTNSSKNGKEGSADPEDKSKNTEAKNGSSTVVNSNTTSNSTTGQFMRLRYIEEIRKRREAQKAQQEAVAAQATSNGANLLAQSNNAAAINASKDTVPDNKGSFAPQDSNIVRPGSQPQAAPANLQLLRQQQMMAEKAQALRARQFQAQQQRQQQARQQLQQQQQQQQQQNIKRQKMDNIPQQPLQAPQSQQQQPQQPYNSISSTPQMGMSQPASSMGTPVMNGTMLTPQQRFQQAQQQALSQQPSQSAPSQPQSQGQIHAQSPVQTPVTAQNQPSQTQIQQQQIFQNTLTPQEQQTFRQLQSRMNAFAMMGNSGIAPNRAQLTQQQQQQAIQQAKLIQQQLLQKFPVYFQRLRQFQLLQQQRRQQQQQQQQQQSASQSPQPMGNIPSSIPQNSQFNQHQNVGGKTIPGGMSPQQQQMINQQMLQQMANNMNQQDKKKMYKKK